MPRISQHHDRVILSPKTQRTNPINFYVYNGPLLIRYDVQWFRTWSTFVDRSNFTKIKHSFLSDVVYEHVLRDHLQLILRDEDHSMAEFGDCAADLGSFGEWIEFLEFFEDEDINDYCFCSYGIWNGFEDCELEEEGSVQQDILWFIAEDWTSIYNCWLFSIFNC